MVGKVRLAVLFISAIIFASTANSEILFRSTFGVKHIYDPNNPAAGLEDRTLDNWQKNASDSYLIQSLEESDDLFQIRRHGKYSLYFLDPDTTNSFAYAVSPTFTNTADEYMVEFWFYVPAGGVSFYHRYPICVPLNINGTDTITTDAQLWVTPIKDPAYLQLTVINNNDTLSAGTIDSLNRWYKLQLHRHNDSVDVYLMSVLKATIKAENNLKTNALQVGAKKTNLQGEAYWDDFIVTTVPVGNHPRLFFTQSDIASLRARSQDNTPTVLGESYKQIFNKDIRDSAVFWVENPSNANFDWYGASFIYPFYQPTEGTNSWTTPAQEQIPAMLEQVALTAAITDSERYYDWLKPVLIAFSTWQQWMHPLTNHPFWLYALQDAGHFTATISMVYDIAFDHLNAYEKMNAQNAILTLGLGQLHYQIFVPAEGPDWWAVPKAGLGIGALVMDPPNMEYLNSSRQDMESKCLYKPTTCDPDGQTAPNGLYSSYFCGALVKWTEAVSHSGLGLPDYYSGPFLSQYARSRAYWYTVRADTLVPPTFYVRSDSMKDNDPCSVYLIAAKLKDPYAQYIASKWPWPNNEFVPWCRFLWFDSSVDTIRPDNSLFPSKIFKDVGYAVFRTGWDISDPVIYLKSGPRPCGHDHDDLNSFIYLGPNGWLLKDDDTLRDTKYHSTILVDGEGQLPIAFDYSAETAARRGYLPKSYCDSVYNYVCSRAESVYVDTKETARPLPEKLSLYRRELLLNNRTKALIVNDYIIAKGQKRNIDWLLACNNRTIYGDSVAIFNDIDTLWFKLLYPTNVSIQPTTTPGIKIDPNPIDTAVAYARYLSIYFPSVAGSSHPVVRSVESDNMRGARVDNSYMMFVDSSAIVGTVSYLTDPFDGVENIVAGLDVNKNYRIVVQETIEGHTVDVIDALSSEGGTLKFDFSPNNKPCKVTITTDFSAPTGSLNINNLYQNFKFVKLSTTANYPYSSVDSVYITQKYWNKINQDTLYSPDVVGFWTTVASGWVPYATSTIQYLYDSEENKENIFEVQYKVGKTVLSSKYSANLYFNDSPPNTGVVSINGGAAFTNNQNVAVQVTGADAFPGLAQMRFSEKPFGNDSGYVNLVKNGTFQDTTGWVLDNAEFYNGFLHLKGFNVGPGPTQIGSTAKQIIPGTEISKHRNKLFRLTDDIYSHDVISSCKIVDIFYADSLYPNGIRLLEKNIASSPEVVWKASSDTFTLKVDTTRPLDRMEVSYNIWEIETPPNPPDDDTQFNTIAVDNIRLEPVELLPLVPNADPVQPSYIYDGWAFVDTNYAYNYTLSVGDGIKKIYMQLSDLAGNISSCPGWADTIILDMTKPLVNIGLPLNNTYINGLVSVWGSATDLSFDKWVSDYKPYLSGEWETLAESTKPTHIGTEAFLYVLNTDPMVDRTYLLRLTAYDLAGNIKADTHYVHVLTEPVLPLTVITSEFATFNSLPVDATCDNYGNIYVTDTQADKIWKFSPEGDSLLCFGYAYTGKDTLGLNHPKGIAVDDSGNIWITDCYQSKVKRYDSAGNYLSTIGKHGNQQGEFNQPTGIAISGNEIYVVDHLNGRVQVFNKAGAYIRQFGNNCLNQPAGIAIRNNETEKLVYVCDSQNDRVAIFDTSGNLVNSLDSLGLDKPWDLCFDNNNNLYIADVYNNRVIELDPWHNKLLTFGIQGQEAGQFKLPQGLAVSPDGKYLYVADTHNDRLQRFKMFFDMGTLGGAQSAEVTSITPNYINKLYQNCPNPFNSKTSFMYQIKNQSQVTFKVYNALGQLVRTLVNETKPAGAYQVEWDGKDGVGRQVSSGVYLYRINTGSFEATKKLVVLK